MKSWSSWIYLAVTVASVAFAAMQPVHQAALDESLGAAARDGFTLPWSGERGAAEEQ